MPVRRWLLAVLVLTSLVSVACAASAGPQPNAEAQAGLEIMRARGCTGCHSTDATPRAGPTFLGLFGSEHDVVGPDGARALTVDAEYVARSIRTPQAEIAQGYPAGVMPPAQLETNEITSVVAALEHLAQPDVVVAQQREPGTLWWLILGAVWFVGGHLVVTHVRSSVIARIGEGPYMGLYSLMAVGGLGLLIYGWTAAPFVSLWTAGPWARWLPFVCMPFVMIGQWVSFSPKGPAAPPKPGQQGPREAPEVRGIHAVTRHPGNLTIALWAIVHLPANGDLAALIFFAAFALLAILGIAHIEHRRMRADPEHWQKVRASSSIVPFAALIGGRARFAWRDAWLPILGGVALYVGFLFAHAWVIGVPALPP